MSEPVVIGDATLYLGDALEILPTLPKVDAVVTDPPYNVGKNYGTCRDKFTEEEYRSLLETVREAAPWHAWVSSTRWMSLYYAVLPEARLVIVERGAQGPLRWGWFDQWQPIMVMGAPAMKMRNLWKDIRLTGEGYFFREETYGHPGYTPTPLMRRLVSIAPPGVVLEPFLGTGTTGVACAQLGRCFIGIEIEPRYFDIACKRIEDAQRQGKLFEPEPEPEQVSLLEP